MKLLALLGFVLAVGAAPLAHADDDDTAYLAAVHSVGVPTASPANDPAYGRRLCERTSDVGFDPLVADVDRENAGTGLTMHQSALVIGAALSNFCLDKVTLLPKDLKY